MKNNMRTHYQFTPLINGFPDRQVRFISNAFSPEECQQIINDVEEKCEFHMGRTGAVEDGDDQGYQSTNIRNIAYPEAHEGFHWLFERLWQCAASINQFYRFNITTQTDPLHYVIYPEPTEKHGGGFLGWHQDLSINRSEMCRKIAITVQLTDPAEYEGGDVQVWFDGTEPLSLSRNIGDIVAFPSYFLHQVTPITKGVRKALVFWVGGLPFV